MLWEYKPSLKIDNTYRYEGPYAMTIALNGVVKKYEIQFALKELLDAVEHHGGLDRIQKLTHKTSKQVIWVVDTLSEEQADWIVENSDDPMGDMKASRATVVMFPEDY